MQRLLGVLALVILAVAEGRLIPRCADGSSPVISSSRVCSCRPAESIRERSKGSLIFVIDDTGSMGTVINGVRNHINSILSANRVFRNYVIATFGDPYRRKVLKTTNADEIRSFLYGIRPVGGGDCPEFALSGVRDAAAEAESNSVLFLFTDASAKDASIHDSVASQLAAKRIRFITVASGNLCRTPGNEYKYIANKTGGQVANLGAGLTSTVMTFIQKAVAGDVSFRVFPRDAAELRRVMGGDCGCRFVDSFKCVPDTDTTDSSTSVEVVEERRCIDPYNGKHYKVGQLWMTKAEQMCFHFKCTPTSNRPYRSDCMSADGSCVEATESGAEFDCKDGDKPAKCQCKKSADGNVLIGRIEILTTET